MGKFLKIFFGCHSMPERSFFWRGKQFPICARCTGELCGMILGIFINLFWGYFSLLSCFIISLPLILDGTIQLKTKWESNNILRLFTGILFGIALISLFVNIHIFIVKLAVMFLKSNYGDSAKFYEIINNLENKCINFKF